MVNWVSRTDEDFLKIRRLLHDFSARMFFFDPKFGKPPESDILDVWDPRLLVLNDPNLNMLIKIISNWAEVISMLPDTYEDRVLDANPSIGRYLRGVAFVTAQEEREFFAKTVLQNLLPLITCYAQGDQVGILDNGYLVQVPGLVRAGDFITRLPSGGLYGEYVIMESCETSITQEQERVIRNDLDDQYNVKLWPFPPGPTAPIQNCRLITSATIWQGLYSHPHAFEEKIFAVH